MAEKSTALLNEGEMLVVIGSACGIVSCGLWIAASLGVALYGYAKYKEAKKTDEK